MLEGNELDCQKGAQNTYYWFEVVSKAGKLIFKAAAPPPSRKLIDEGMLLLFVDKRLPSKYGSRLTGTPLNMPLFKIPVTTTPTFGVV